MHADRSKYHGLCWVGLFLLLAVAALPVDMPVARAFREWYGYRAVAGWLRTFDYFELFGHGIGAVIILLAIHQLDPARRWAIPRLACCLLAAGGLANLIKICVIRMRPYGIDLQCDVWATFGGFGWTTLGVQNRMQSFPSAHTTLAVALATVLTYSYPRGRWLFYSLAALVGCQRVVCGAHFPSDVFAGAAVGYFTAMLFFSIGLLPGWFSRWEKNWRST